MARNSAILFGTYCDALMSRAIEQGYAAPIDVGVEEFGSLTAWCYDVRYRRNPHKTAVLQMLLLFDEIVLINAESSYDCSRLMETGMVKVVSDDDDALLVRIPGHPDHCSGVMPITIPG